MLIKSAIKNTKKQPTTKTEGGKRYVFCFCFFFNDVKWRH